MRKCRKNFWQPVAAGFGTMYLLTMGLATLLVKEKFVEDYNRQFETAAASITGTVSEKEFSMEGRQWDSQKRKDFYQSLADKSHWTLPGGAFEISVAFYDENMELLAKSRDQAGGNTFRTGAQVKREYLSFGLDDYLTPKEKDELARYCYESIQADRNRASEPSPFRFCLQSSPDEQELWGIYVQKIIWQEKDGLAEEHCVDSLTGRIYTWESDVKVDYQTGEELSQGKTYIETASQVVWQWLNPEVEEARRRTEPVLDSSVTFPYMGIYENGSYDRWKRWSASPYLHGYPDSKEFRWEPGPEEPPLVVASDGFYYRAAYQLQIGIAGEPFSYMEIRMESRPWLDALDYMKYVYGAGLALTLACAIKISFAFSKIYARQKALEDARRDFTNAMAHELKTPLGIIRNFAENLLEHNMEEKRDYYLSQIIGQTEEMDELVVRMIEVSKLDSEELTLKKESVAFSELIQEQLARLEPLIREKGIHVECQDGGDFVAEGDREYLARAVWNLLSNAAEHNIPGGKILIRTEKDQCVIENTGTPVREEDLPHVFDLFYTGDASRGRSGRNMGIGLFLTRKILKIHGMEIEMKNLKDGVRVTIKAEGSRRKYL